MLPLKEDDTFAVLSDKGFAEGEAHGFYRHDTRYLSLYSWSLQGFSLLVSETPRPDQLAQHWGLIIGPDQAIGLRRELRLTRGGFTEHVLIENTDLRTHSLTVELIAQADFADLFEARGWRATQRSVDDMAYTAEDGLEVATRLNVNSTPPPVLTHTRANAATAERTGKRVYSWALELAPKQRFVIEIDGRFKSPFEPNSPPLPSYEAWRARFGAGFESGRSQRVLEQGIDDLRALLFSQADGLFPAAGIPWYVTAFGRDSLITAYMTQPWAPDMTRSVLTYLASVQGSESNAARDEAPGKIIHEVRLGELARTGVVPFRRYYGTVDATALFVILLHRYWLDTQDLEFVKQLRPNWEAALKWLQEMVAKDPTGLLRYAPNAEGGHTVQSWKDSHDSQSHRDGSLAQGAIAVCEVQGYLYMAYEASAAFYSALENGELAQSLHASAATLKSHFHERFWLPERKTYAAGLDGDNRPMAILTSNPGHLLWSGIVPEEIVPTLVKTMFDKELWSGWGVRTLGSGEARYNPLSYHNGSVWPHDNAIFIGGLVRYGYIDEALKAAEALFRLAMTQADWRLPELVGGYDKHASEPPVPYPASCRPQAWDAAAVVYILRLVQEISQTRAVNGLLKLRTQN
jgi:glycogen debranching enzyme